MKHLLLVLPVAMAKKHSSAADKIYLATENT
jgi:hypothetical protein